MSFISSSCDEYSEIVIPTASEEEYRLVQELYDKVKGGKEMIIKNVIDVNVFKIVQMSLLL